MNVLWGGLILVAVTAVAVSAMLFVRRGAPEGSYFSDGDRASGVFGVLATGFSVLMAFIIFLAFESYDASRSGATDEASILVQQLETTQFLPQEVRAELTSELVCYARNVAGAEWQSVEDGTLGDTINPWTGAMFLTMQTVDPQTSTEESAYDRWQDQSTARQQARNDRVHGVDGIIPTPLWAVLYLMAAVIFVYMLFFADSGERAVTQGMLMGSVAAVVTFSLLLINFFDDPYGDGLGQLQPVAMERSLRLMDDALDIIGLELTYPCDADGNPS